VTQPSDALNTVNDWLGWGDPKRGLWFIGVEEGAPFTAEKISSMRGKTYQAAPKPAARTWPIAVRTARIVCELTGNPSPAVYRSSRMWQPGSGVFNGNLRPLGRPSLSAWPAEYQALFGLTADDYRSAYDGLMLRRYEAFRAFRAECQPQAIICFGKGCWEEFEEVFVANRREAVASPELDMRVYESSRVVLTQHFARGSLMPNRAVEYLGSILKRWNVTVPQ